MAWIPMIPEDEAEGELKEWYDRLRDPWGGVDEIMRIHSISLPTMKGHYELYKSAKTGNPDLSRKEHDDRHRGVLDQSMPLLNGASRSGTPSDHQR